MKIQAKNKNIKSMKLSVPVDGLIEIDANGIVEVSEECGRMLIEGTNDWEKFGEGKDTKNGKKGSEKAPASGKKEEGEGEGNEGCKGEGGEGQLSDKEAIEALQQLSLADCIETAKAAGYPEKEWEKLSKNEKSAEKLMRTYLVKKYKDSMKK